MSTIVGRHLGWQSKIREIILDEVMKIKVNMETLESYPGTVVQIPSEQ